MPQYFLRNELEVLVRDKDRIIEIKSVESANLKRLAKQFSPAVIRAIESKTIELNQRDRKKVAVIFIDSAATLIELVTKKNPSAAAKRQSTASRSTLFANLPNIFFLPPILH